MDRCPLSHRLLWLRDIGVYRQTRLLDLLITSPAPHRHGPGRECDGAISSKRLGSRRRRGLAAWAQQRERMRRIGVLLPATADDADFQTWYGAFLRRRWRRLGWTIGDNVRIDIRWATNNPASIRRHAAELVALAPDVILAHGTSTLSPLLQISRAVPI